MDTAPAYLVDSLRPMSEVVAGRCLCSADVTPLYVPSTRLSTTRSATASFLWLHRGRGTVCHYRPGPPHHDRHTVVKPILFCFVNHLVDKQSIEDIFDDCDDQLFSRINTNSLHILQQYLPDRPSLNYSLRPRRHNITLITKTSELNHHDFIIRNIYKDLY